MVLNSLEMLPLWAEALLVLAVIGAGLRASWLARRARTLEGRLQARERGSHFLGESPEPRQIVQHAYRAAAEILPLSGFNLYRLDAVTANLRGLDAAVLRSGTPTAGARRLE